jgi:hypothetical protein
MEFVRYNVWPDGMLGDQHRWNDNGNPCKGYWYPGTQLGDMALLAEAFARIGDLDLYTYTTSEGYAGTAGGPKNLEKVIHFYHGIVDHSMKRYATKDKKNAGSSRYLIDSDCNDGWNWDGVEDTFAAVSNRFYRDDNIKAGYMRKGPGDPPYPASPNAPGGCGSTFEGPSCVAPSLLFMFGQMEKEVWPYPTSQNEPGPQTSSAPKNLRFR